LFYEENELSSRVWNNHPELVPALIDEGLDEPFWIDKAVYVVSAESESYFVWRGPVLRIHGYTKNGTICVGDDTPLAEVLQEYQELYGIKRVLIVSCNPGNGKVDIPEDMEEIVFAESIITHKIREEEERYKRGVVSVPGHPLLEKIYDIKKVMGLWYAPDAQFDNKDEVIANRWTIVTSKSGNNKKYERFPLKKRELRPLSTEAAKMIMKAIKGSSSPVVESIVRTVTGSRGLLSIGAAAATVQEAGETGPAAHGLRLAIDNNASSPVVSMFRDRLPETGKLAVDISSSPARENKTLSSRSKMIKRFWSKLRVSLLIPLVIVSILFIAPSPYEENRGLIEQTQTLQQVQKEGLKEVFRRFFNVTARISEKGLQSATVSDYNPKMELFWEHLRVQIISTDREGYFYWEGPVIKMHGYNQNGILFSKKYRKPVTEVLEMHYKGITKALLSVCNFQAGTVELPE
ncbi:MAG: hypothetical protein KAR31_08255, partial [Candidatus Omnitrophica bacterium]|nr:hypothetical protein [Candidatus Omnitrophota bacterium]